MVYPVMNGGDVATALSAASSADRTAVQAAVAKLGIAPFFANNLFATMGNSYGEHGVNNTTTGTVGTRYTSVGLQHWISVLSGGRARFPMAYNFSVSGAKSDAIIATQLAPAMATDAAFILCPNLTLNDHRGANGGASTLPWETTKANIDALVAACRFYGKHLIIGNDPGVGSSSDTGQRFTATELALRNRTNRYLETYNGTPRVTVFDWDSLISDHSSSTGDSNALYYRDTVHPNQTGDMLCARDLIVPEVVRLAPRRNPLISSNADKWSVDNPLGALNTNPMMKNIGGTTGPGGGTINGDVAQGATVGISSGAGVTLTCSLVTVGDYTYQRIVISGTPTGGALNNGPQVTFYQLLTLTPLVVGSKVSAAMDMIIAPGSSGIQDVSSVLSLRDGSSTEINQARMGGYALSDAFAPMIGWSGPYETPEIIVPATLGAATRVMGRVTLIQNVPANMTIDIGRMSARMSA